jgi:hypothetical protein
MDLPIKGQEVLCSVISPDGLETSFDHFKDHTFTFMLDIIQESYLGQVTDQFDEIFRGVKIELTLDLANSATLDFVTKIVDRAQRRTAAATKFSITSALKFPNGQRRRMAFPDIKFGEIPVAFGKRDQYGEMKITANGSTFRKL